MSDDNKDLGDRADDAFDSGRDSAKDFRKETREASDDFTSEAKKTANEFSEGLKGAGGENKKILAGILAIILGSLGVHKFMLGYNKEGFILLGFTLVSYALVCLFIGAFLVWIPAVIGLIEGIIYLTKTDEDFYNTYQVGKKPWF